jgi:hypothetical protein
MNPLRRSPRLCVLMAVYFAASLAHFAHNAEYIAFYPGMPGWISRETVYLAWLVVTSVGAAGLLAAWLGAQSLGLLLIGAYGALGLDGLGHYTLALCSEHTLGANVTIWAEVVTGAGLLLTSAVLVVQTVAGMPAGRLNAAE